MTALNLEDYETTVDDKDSFENVANQLNDLLSSSSEEERDIFLELMVSDDTQAFEDKMKALRGDKGHNLAEENGSPTSQESFQDKKAQEAKDFFDFSVMKAVLTYFERDSKLKQEEAFTLERKLTGKADAPKISENDARVLSRSDNPYIRMMVASYGFCAKTLSNDPISYIRLEVLKKTGVYSEYYRERERNISVIKELITQGIDNEFYRNFNSETKYLVEVQDKANEIIEALETGCTQTYQTYLDDLKKMPDLNAKYQEGQIHIDIVMQSFRTH